MVSIVQIIKEKIMKGTDVYMLSNRVPERYVDTYIGTHIGTMCAVPRIGDWISIKKGAGPRIKVKVTNVTHVIESEIDCHVVLLVEKCPQET